MIPGGYEWLIILIVVLIVFGAGRLPKVMKDLGKGVKSFKDGVSEDSDKADKKKDDK